MSAVDASDSHTLQIAPTVLDNVTFADPVMQEEIFGPVLPVLTFDSLEEAIRNLQTMPHPLALYLFTSDRAARRKSNGFLRIRRRLHQRYHHPSCHQ